MSQIATSTGAAVNLGNIATENTPLQLSKGGTNADTSAATTGQILRNSGAAFVATTATYPATGGTAGNFIRSDGTNFSSVAIGAASKTTSNPTAITGTTLKMVGLNMALTPSISGKVLVMFQGSYFNNTAGAGTAVQISYGTGTAPTNAAALTGTQVGSVMRSANSNLAGSTSTEFPFSLAWFVTGLTVNTAYWFDLASSAVASGTPTFENVTGFVIEL